MNFKEETNVYVEESVESSYKPAIFIICSLAILYLVSKKVVEAEVRFWEIPANMFYAPLSFLDLQGPITNTVAATIIGWCGLMVIKGRSKALSSISFYSGALMGTYVVYLGILLALRGFNQAFLMEGPWAIAVGLAAILLLVLLFFSHFDFTKNAHKIFVHGDSKASQKVQELWRADNEKPKTQGTKDNRATSSNYLLAERVRNEIKKVPLDRMLTFDTNILIKCPSLIKELSRNYPIRISKKVFEELDKKKTDKMLGQNVRKAMRIIESIQVQGGDISFIYVEEEFLKENGLNSEIPDDVIVGCCLKLARKGEKIVFISEDRGARSLARDNKIEVMNL